MFSFSVTKKIIFFWKTKLYRSKIVDIIGRKIMNVLKIVKIRIRKRKLKKKFRLRRYLRIPKGFQLLYSLTVEARSERRPPTKTI